MKYDRIEAMRQDYPIAVLCRVFEVGTSSYYAWRQRAESPRARENARLEVQIAEDHERTRQTYGRERLQADLRDHGVRVGLYRIRRIRSKLGLRCKQRCKFKKYDGFQARSASRTEFAGTQFRHERAESGLGK